jgi:hypothetical protein
VTVTLEVPVLPPIVAVITADPVFTPVTSPFAATVATLVLLEDHATVRPVRTLLFASRGVAVNVILLPFFTDAGAGVTVTVATGFAVTVTVVPTLFVSLVAVMVALSGLLPVLFPVTTAVRPVGETVAILELLVLQLTARSVTTTPF